jgi:hypothetical protein
MDFLRKFVAFATGALDPTSDPDFSDGSGPVPSSDQWVQLVNGASMPDIPGSGMATDGEVYLMGPGSDPDDEIIVGIKTYRNAGNNTFGWELRGFTQFNDALTWDTLPGVSPSAFAAYDDATFDCYFWVNARRIMALARIGTVDILVHLGFIQQFGTRSQYPYPLLITGAQISTAFNFQASTFGQSSIPDPCQNGAFLRWVDGSWLMFRNYQGTDANRGNARLGDGNVMWPHRDPAVARQNYTNFGSESGLFEAFGIGGTQVSFNEIDAYGLHQVCLLNSTQAIGRIDGLFFPPGAGLTTGDTLTDNSESPPKVYDVFKNCWRGEQIDYYAILRE